MCRVALCLCARHFQRFHFISAFVSQMARRIILSSQVEMTRRLGLVHYLNNFQLPHAVWHSPVQNVSYSMSQQRDA
jgi:hypothetical protein